jgi:hypothetical protein
MRKDVREFIRRLETVGLTVESTPGHYRVLHDGKPLRKANGMPLMLPFSPDTIRCADPRSLSFASSASTSRWLMPRSRASGCVIWRVQAAIARTRAAYPRTESERALRDGRAAPRRPASPPLSRRALERPAHAPEEAISWHQPSSSCGRSRSRSATRYSSEIGGIAVLARTNDPSLSITGRRGQGWSGHVVMRVCALHQGHDRAPWVREI